MRHSETIYLTITFLFSLIILAFQMPENSIEKDGNETQNLNSLHKLDSLCDVFMQYDRNKAIGLAFRMEKQALRIHNENYLHKAYNYIAYGFYSGNKYDSAYKYVNIAFQSSDSDINPSLHAKSFIILSDINFYQGKHEAGLKNAKKAQEIYFKTGDSLNAAKINKDIAVLYRETGNYDMAIDFIIKSLSYFESKKDSLYIADAYRVLASFYNSHGFNDPEKEYEYIVNSKDYLSNFRDSELYYIITDDLANYFSKNSRKDTALIIVKELLSIQQERKDSLNLANTYLALGNLYGRISLDSIVQAKEAFYKAIEIYSDLNIEKYVCHVEAILGELYYAVYEYDSAEYFLEKSMSLAKSLNYSLIYKHSISVLNKVYEEKGDFEKAYVYYKELIRYTDSLQSESTRIKIAELETKYETEKKEKQIQHLEHQKEVEKTERHIQLLIFSIVLVLVGLIVLMLLIKRKKDKQIHRQLELFLKKDKELADAKLEQSKLKEEELTKSITYKSKQLSTHALSMMQKNSMLQEIQGDLKEISKKANDNSAVEFRRINQIINQSLRADKDWDLFKYYFEEINKEFFKKIEELIPNVTSNDLRLCALIKLNMNTKEMASVLNITPNSMKSARYRLKKKLALESDESLEKYIRNLS